MAAQAPFWILVAVFGGLALASAVAWLRALRAARHSEDLPTTRIRAAAQGYVELFGLTRPGDGGMLRAPLSDTACVWWSYEVVETHKDRTEVRRETSRQPFYLEDGTGRCLVDPREADITPSRTERWLSGKSPARQDAVSATQASATRTQYAVTESVLLPASRLYVLGEFRTRRKAAQPLDLMRSRLAAWLQDSRKRAVLDVNRDGQVDDTEMEAARRAAMLDARRQAGTSLGVEDMVVKPRDGRPFVVAPRVERAHVQGRRTVGLLHLVMALVSGGVFLALLALA